MNKEDRKKLANKQLEVLNKIEESMALEHTIKNNTIEFKSSDKLFRVRKPSFTERQDIFEYRRKGYLKLVKDDSMLFRKQWIDLYKKKGIDIDKMDAEMKNMQAELESSLLKIVKLTDEKAIGNIQKEIIALRQKMWQLNIERTDLLQHSIEDQLLLQVNSFTTYLVLEIFEDNNWKKYFKTYDDFQNCNDNDLMTKTFKYISDLIYGGYIDNESEDTKKSS